MHRSSDFLIHYGCLDPSSVFCCPAMTKVGETKTWSTKNMAAVQITLPSKNQSMFEDVAHLLEAVSSLFLSLDGFHVWQNVLDAPALAQQETSWRYEAGTMRKNSLDWITYIVFQSILLTSQWYDTTMENCMKESKHWKCHVPKIPRTLTLKINHAPFPFVESWTLQIKRQISQRHPTGYLVRWH